MSYDYGYELGKHPIDNAPCRCDDCGLIHQGGCCESGMANKLRRGEWS